MLLRGGSWGQQANDRSKSNRLRFPYHTNRFILKNGENLIPHRMKNPSNQHRSSLNTIPTNHLESIIRTPPNWDAKFEADLRTASKRRNIKYFNKLIVDFGQRKRPLLAQRIFDAIGGADLTPNEYSWTCLVNAHVRSGDTRRAEAAFRAMKDAGFAPGAAAFTAMIKGLSNSGCIGRCSLFAPKRAHSHSYARPRTLAATPHSTPPARSLARARSRALCSTRAPPPPLPPY
jgi:pentatricopeptide repeat protein